MTVLPCVQIDDINLILIITMKLYLLFFEVDKILVIVENLDIGERSPSSLNLLCSQNILRLLSLLLFPLLISTPSPLNLDSSDMVHSKSMILE